MTDTKRWLVRGRVQGVGYRAFVVEVARRASVTGYVRNLADGRLEVVAAGAPDVLDQVEAALREGPSLAHVEQLVAEPAPAAVAGHDFTIRPSEEQGWTH